jgi:hypothetical protein
MCVIWGLSGIIAGGGIVGMLYRHFGAVKAEHFWNYAILAIVGFQTGLLTRMHLKARREWKAMMAEHDAMLDRMKATMLAENPGDHAQINEFIGEMRRLIPRR